MNRWLTARPVAHRGLHDRASGRIENSLSAARAAVAQNYAIECDVQISSDGEAMVFHDDVLDRLTHARGRVDAQDARALGAMTLKDSDDRIASFPDWLAVVAGATPVVCEIKSAFDGDMRLATRTAQIAASCAGRIALKSFDPAVIAFLRREGAALGLSHIPLGLVAEARYDADDWSMLTADQRAGMTALTHLRETRPDFLSWSVRDLPHSVPSLCRAYGTPVLTWTVRTPDQAATSKVYSDQMIFEGFSP